ncbi:MAG TPA: class I SAM-dependent methyltransferase [Methanospirillum sp.]|nr:class I SAM-dependent methyltransferase [Methanospirillum sp.]
MNTHDSSIPDVKENVRTYWNERSKTFDNDVGHGADENEKRLWKQYLSEIIGSEPKKVLDVGTGTGMIATTLAELGHIVTGIDLGEKMMEIARRKAELLNLQITFMLGDAEGPDFPDNTFDCVICRHLLWTLPHPDTAIREWSRVCRPGGLIIAIDGHTRPHDYFPNPEEAGLENLNDQQKLWYQMYSRDVVDQLPLKYDMSVDFLKSYFSNLHLTGVQHKHIDEISEYQKNLTRDKQVGDHCEVNIIWGMVQKSE